MKTFLRMFKYVRDLEEQLARANYWIEQIRAQEVEKIEASVSLHQQSEKDQLGAWIFYQMKRRRVTMADIATLCDVSIPSVHTVIWGKRTSARIQKQVATSLGYSTWRELLATRREVAA